MLLIACASRSQQPSLMSRSVTSLSRHPKDPLHSSSAWLMLEGVLRTTWPEPTSPRQPYPRSTPYAYRHGSCSQNIRSRFSSPSLYPILISDTTIAESLMTIDKFVPNSQLRASKDTTPCDDRWDLQLGKHDTEQSGVSKTPKLESIPPSVRSQALRTPHSRCNPMENKCVRYAG